MVNRILITLIAALFLPGIYLTLADWTPAPHQEDFGAYYLAARALAEDKSAFDPDVAANLARAAGVESHSPYIYPPLLALLLRPVAALPYRIASPAWFFLSAGALFAALCLLRPVFALPWRIYGWLCAAAFFLPPVHHTLQHGQITNFLLLLIVAAAVRNGTAGAVWLGIAAALKVFPATIVLAYARKGRMTLLAAMVSTAALMTAGGAFVEPEATAEFARRVAPQLAAERRLAPNNQSVFAVFARWFETHWFVSPIIDAPAAGLFLSYAAVVVVAGMTLRALWFVRRADDPSLHIGRICLVLAATLIVSPIVWDHYYVLLLLPAALLYRNFDDPTVAVLLLTGVALLLSHRFWPLTLSLKSPLFMSSGLAGVAVLWIALLKAVRYDRVCAARPSRSAVSPSVT